VGIVNLEKSNSDDSLKTLLEVGLEAGDYMDIAIIKNNGTQFDTQEISRNRSGNGGDRNLDDRNVRGRDFGDRGDRNFKAVRNSSDHKDVVCLNFMRTGNCKYGENCRFSH
jgi:hypothetical protein